MAEDYIKSTTVTSDGEILSQNVKKYYNPFKEGKGYNFKYKSTNIKTYLDIPLPKEFTDSEIGKLTRLSRHIYSATNLLAKRISGRIVALDRDEIQQTVGLSRAKFSTFWRKAVKLKVLKTIRLDDQDFVCFNPVYFNSTVYLPIHLFIAFQTELAEHLPDWVVRRYLEMEEKTNEKQAVSAKA